MSSFNRIPRVGLSPLLYFLLQPQPWITLMDCKLVGCGYSVISSQFQDSTNWLSSHLSDPCQGSLMDQNRWSPQYLGDFVVLVCPLKTQSSQAMDKRDRNRDNCVIKHYLLCFSCTLASRLSLLFSGAVFHVVTYPPFCLNCVPLLLLILLTGVDATDIALYEWQISLNTLFISCPS